ncbi:unnamed protein product [Dibothriocephalus latus]|uniref:VWFA domain-containing protein n=1 Tax=Dibothriocephalus latus TaxID=60516 RepID=A0A3P7LJ90_DIBLA|nr:unnamed protein product [Dibothriocephalus latus]
MTLFEQRINWLGRNSRATFGTLAEKCVVLLLDFSEFSRPCLEKMFRYLRHLLQEQIAVYVEWFNLIAICETMEVFHTECVPVNPDNLQEAWVWLLARHAGGTRNFLAGFKYVFERMKDQQQQHQQPVGFYLFATGVADQEDSPLAAYVSSALAVRGGYLHCVLFSTEKSKESKESEAIQTGRFADPQETAQSLRSLANETGGRFHWFSESGVIQSDDVQQLMDEISRAVHFSLTGKQLIDQFRTKYAKPSVTSSCEKRTCLRDKTNVISIATPVKPDPNSIPTTSLSEARRIFLRRKQQEAKRISKSLTWQPQRAQIARMKRLTPALTESFFYSEETNKVETVLGRTNKVPGIRKGIRKESIPANEEFVSSSEWLSKYSTKAQRVSLARLLSGIGCRHRTEVIRPGSMQVSARYCADLFPLIQVRGKTRHFQLTPDQCNNFELQVRNLLKRYRKRLFWLLSSPRVYLGVLLEDCIIFVIDISASMQCVVEDLKEKLERIIWEDVCK